MIIGPLVYSGRPNTRFLPMHQVASFISAKSSIVVRNIFILMMLLMLLPASSRMADRFSRACFCEKSVGLSIEVTASCIYRFLPHSSLYEGPTFGVETNVAGAVHYLAEFDCLRELRQRLRSLGGEYGLERRHLQVGK